MSKNELSDEEKALFRDLMRHVKPLSPSKKITIEPKPALVKPREKTVAQSASTTLPYHLSDFYETPVTSDSLLSYAQTDLPKKRFRQLQSGQIDIDARLDLHGLHANRAKVIFTQFICKQITLEKRCLLIVHGKGGQKGQAPILKNLVNQWLRQIPTVLAFHSALASDGGTGAVYVLLKRIAPNRDKT